MNYNNGYLNIAVRGFYYIYAQLFSKDGTAVTFSLYIDDKVILKSYHIKRSFIAGVFYVATNQRISLRTKSSKYFKYSSTDTFFGAFIIHP